MMLWKQVAKKIMDNVIIGHEGISLLGGFYAIGNGRA